MADRLIFSRLQRWQLPATVFGLLLTFLAVMTHAESAGGTEDAAEVTSPVILIHGGAGALSKGRYSAAEEQAHRERLQAALDAGFEVLLRGESAVQAVTAAIVVLEDSPYFNAGRGAVFTYDGRNELDASIMDGATGNAGAVASVTTVKNPILLAEAVMSQSGHVMLAGQGAEQFAASLGWPRVDPGYFWTQRRWDSYRRALKATAADPQAGAQSGSPSTNEHKFGTVGAVALDQAGHLAAGTSTGGMTLKRFGRVGDSPIIGAGTYASDTSCAVSATGWGEYFIRLTIARDICAQVEYADRSLADAAADMIHKRLPAAGGDGGVIALQADGTYTMQFNTSGMFRGVRSKDEQRVAIYRD